MKKTLKNSAVVEGRLYQFKLDKREVTKEDSKYFGKEYISGTLSVATDEEGVNIVDVTYGFIPSVYLAKEDKPERDNVTFKALEKILNGEKPTWIKDGKDNAAMVKLTPNINLNDFYLPEGGDYRLVSAKRLEGGYVNFVNSLSPEKDAKGFPQRSYFDVDMVINKVTRVEANEETGAPEYARIHGAIFSNFYHNLLPLDFTANNPSAIDYFEGLDASERNKIFTNLKGEIINTVKNEAVSEEGAFGTIIKMVPKRDKRWNIYWAQSNPYDFGDESVLTDEELKAASQTRQIYLAEKKDDAKKRAENNTFETLDVPVGTTVGDIDSYLF